jgi:hypothetical protein
VDFEVGSTVPDWPIPDAGGCLQVCISAFLRTSHISVLAGMKDTQTTGVATVYGNLMGDWPDSYPAGLIESLAWPDVTKQQYLGGQTGKRKCARGTLERLRNSQSHVTHNKFHYTWPLPPYFDSLLSFG